MPRKTGKRLLSGDEIAQVEEMWGAGERIEVICLSIGVTRDTLVARRCDQLAHLPQRRQGSGPKPRGFLPDEKEIESRAAAVRAKWTPEEEAERRTNSWQLQVFRIDD